MTSLDVVLEVSATRSFAFAVVSRVVRSRQDIGSDPEGDPSSQEVGLLTGLLAGLLAGFADDVPATLTLRK